MKVDFDPHAGDLGIMFLVAMVFTTLAVVALFGIWESLHADPDDPAEISSMSDLRRWLHRNTREDRDEK